MLFASPWHFLAQDVLFGVHKRGGQLLLAAEPGNDPVFLCWTNANAAAAQIHPDYRVVHSFVRDVLPALPPGVGIWVDPGTPEGTNVPAAQVASFVPECVPFPPGRTVALGDFESLPPGLIDALRAALESRSFLRRLWIFRYAVENGPSAMCIAWDGPAEPEPDEDAIAVITQALDGTVRGTEWDAALGQVPIFRVRELPDEIRTWVFARPPAVGAS